MIQILNLNNLNELVQFIYLETPICGLRPLTRTSPSLMYKLTEILRILIDGVRKQHIHNITMIFYKKNDINTVKKIA